MAHTREDTAPLKVIGLGLGRTGTLSLRDALEILGFGPCHHPIRRGVDDEWAKFAKAAKDGATPEYLDDLYRGYVSAVDSTTAILAEPLYKAYPDAKFILTVRDPAEWLQSMKKTLLKSMATSADAKLRVASGIASEEERISSDRLKAIGMSEWFEVYQNGYHQGRLETDPEGELLRHNQYIMQLIPPEKLLVYNVAEGWKPLADFLGVPEPNVPFPRLNNSEQYEERSKEWWQKLTDSGRNAEHGT